MGIVIGKDAHNVKAKDAYQYIAGYCVINDVSERFWQLKRGSQWDKGKGFPSFSPTGPYLVTTDEIPDPHNLEMWLEVNGKRMQTGNTNDMIFDVPTIIEYVSTCYGLIAGDIITTGTPPGVGLGMTPNVFFKSGDVVRLGIEKLGISEQHLVAA